MKKLLALALAVMMACLITGIPIGGLLAAFLARRMSVWTPTA